VKRPIYQGGKKVGETVEYSDRLLEFLLKGLKPETYRENYRGERKEQEPEPDPDFALLTDEELKTHRTSLEALGRD
jgi:alpha-D-ribose 1-methylphosphonate 5-triphosphate synthase subunit PhnI